MGKKVTYLLLAVLVLGPVVANAASLGPVGWWRFDEKTGTTAADSSPNKNNGTINGGAAWTPGQIDGAVLCDGNNDYVSLPIGSVISKLTSATFAVWTNYSQQGGAWQRILDFGTGETVNMFLTPAIGGSNTGVLRFAITTSGSGGESQLSAANRLVADWHHVAVVINGDSRAMQMFLDGEVVANGSTQVLPNALGTTTNNWLGRSNYAADAYYSGALDDFRIYDRALSQSDIKTVMKGGGYGVALGPQPVDRETDVSREVMMTWIAGQTAKTHDVYLGTTEADVTNASRSNKLGVLVSQGQDAHSYDPPARLEFGQTYFWRVDEVNAAPDSTIFKGAVWSFTVEPFSYEVAGVTATASSFNKDMGPEKTVDGSGLSPVGEHSTVATDMWLSAKGGAQPTWIQYAFDRVYKLDKLSVWNSNQALESILGFGAKDVKVEYSTDGSTWTVLGDVEFTQALGVPGYTADTTVAFSGVMAKYVKLTISSNWGGLLPQYGLSEVRFYYLPVFAREPSPASAGAGVNPQATLTWRAGREAASHTVYLSTDKQAVIDGTAPATTVSGPSYEAAVGLGQTYYWKVVEVNEAEKPSTWESDVWSFVTSEYVVIDDFESCTDDEGGRIYETWADGWVNGSGSQVGYLEAPFAERTTVHGGRQAMPLVYDNSSAPQYSETTRTFKVAQDWTLHGVTTLVVYFRGNADNGAAPLYAKINDKKVVYNNGVAVTATALWKQWNIDLASVGTNLKSVKSLTIGVGDGGGKGTLFVDDILLYGTAPAVVTPADPGKTGIVALYTMDDNVQDTSGKNNHGQTSGDVTYENAPAGRGKALVFNGTNTYVQLPIGSVIAGLGDTTIATHVFFSNTGGAWQRIFDFGSGTTINMFLTPRMGTAGTMRFALRTATVGEQQLNPAMTLPSGWHHVAVAIDSKTMTMVFYLDGDVVATGATTLLPKDMGNTTQNWLGRSQYTADAYFTGILDDFRIYNRALSAAEVRYLAGDR